MWIEIRSYVFDGNTYWVSSVGGAVAGVAQCAKDAVASAVTESKSRARLHGMTSDGDTVWEVVSGGYVVLDARGCQPSEDERQNLMSLVEIEDDMRFKGQSWVSSVVAVPPRPPGHL